jgi:hypothetical protein
MEEIPSSPAPSAPSYYAQPRFLARRALRDWWTVLHPPYTLLHLSLVTIGACLTGPVSAPRLVATLAAFFLAVGVGAHCLDELHGRPLHTELPTWQLVTAATLGLGGAIGLGVVGLFVVGGWFGVFIVVGVTVAIGYNLELFAGRLHTRAAVVLSWGGFPILTAYYAQHRSLSLAAVFAAGFGTLMTLAQQQLSTPARDLRRRTVSIEGVVHRLDGTSVALTKEMFLAPLESTLKTLCRAGPLLALAFVAVRFIHH